MNYSVPFWHRCMKCIIILEWASSIERSTKKPWQSSLKLFLQYLFRRFVYNGNNENAMKSKCNDFIDEFIHTIISSSSLLSFRWLNYFTDVCVMCKANVRQIVFNSLCLVSSLVAANYVKIILTVGSQNGCTAGCSMNTCLLTPVHARRAFALALTGKGTYRYMYIYT